MRALRLIEKGSRLLAFAFSLPCVPLVGLSEGAERPTPVFRCVVPPEPPSIRRTRLNLGMARTCPLLLSLDSCLGRVPSGKGPNDPEQPSRSLLRITPPTGSPGLTAATAPPLREGLGQPDQRCLSTTLINDTISSYEEQANGQRTRRTSEDWCYRWQGQSPQGIRHADAKTEVGNGQESREGSRGIAQAQVAPRGPGRRRAA